MIVKGKKKKKREVGGEEKRKRMEEEEKGEEKKTKYNLVWKPKFLTNSINSTSVCLHVCVRGCVPAWMCACMNVRECVSACVRVRVSWCCRHTVGWMKDVNATFMQMNYSGCEGMLRERQAKREGEGRREMTGVNGEEREEME